jgi:hypothetical protein
VIAQGFEHINPSADRSRTSSAHEYVDSSHRTRHAVKRHRVRANDQEVD